MGLIVHSGPTIGIKFVETLLSFRIYFELGAKMAPYLAPPAGDNVVLFSVSYEPSQQRYNIDLGGGGRGGEREGYPRKILFGLIVFANNESVVSSVLCWQVTLN